MKKLLLLILFLPLVFAMPAEQVQLNNYVNDYAKVLSSSDVTELSSIAKSMQDNNKAEYAIVIVENLEGADTLSYAQTIAEGNLGNENNNGLLLLVSIEDREYRFHTGRGLEAELPDILLGRITRTYLVPAFKEENYGAGIIAASKAIDAELDGQPYVEPEISTSLIIISIIINLIFFFMPIIIVIVLIIIINKNKKPPKKGEKRSNSDLFAAAMLGSMLGRGGRGGGGSFGGGFGGFGGGSFGGGGAGGGW